MTLVMERLLLLPLPPFFLRHAPTQQNNAASLLPGLLRLPFFLPLAPLSLKRELDPRNGPRGTAAAEGEEVETRRLKMELLQAKDTRKPGLRNMKVAMKIHRGLQEILLKEIPNHPILRTENVHLLRVDMNRDMMRARVYWTPPMGAKADNVRPLFPFPPILSMSAPHTSPHTTPCLVCTPGPDSEGV